MLYTDNRQNKIEVNDKFIELINDVCNYALKEEDVNIPYQISLLFVDNDEIREINRDTRGIDNATDVLSFPMFEKNEIENILMKKELKVEDVLGDIVISLERVYEQAKEYNHSFERELAYMLVHGFYHLMGYDHIEEKDKEQMRPKEEKILQDLNITRI